MESSHNHFVEPMTRGSRQNAERVRLVIRALSDRFIGEPFPSMSEHYKPEEESIADPEPVQEFIHVTDHLHGWDSLGNYH